MELVEKTRPMRDNPVTIFMDEEDHGIKQPNTFRLCPLGLQFYSNKQMSECSLLEFKLDLPADKNSQSHIACSGIVVNCQIQEHQSLYRIWVKFLDLPDSARSRIKCVSKSTNLLCPFCENF